MHKVTDSVYVVTKDGQPVVPKSGKKMPKAYTNPKNAHIAIQNMGGYGEGYQITIYEPVGFMTQIDGINTEPCTV